MGDDGIVRIRIGKIWGEKAMEKTMKDTVETIKWLPTKVRILVDLGSAPHIASVLYRRNVARLARDAVKNIRFEKVAVYGGTGGVIQRTVVSFIISAARLKNIKIFKTEKEALKWLKED